MTLEEAAEAYRVAATKLEEAEAELRFLENAKRDAEVRASEARALRTVTRNLLADAALQ